MDLFYLTNSSSYENIVSILKDGVIYPGGGEGMSTYNNKKSKYLYFELVFPEYQRNAPGIGIYFSPKLLEDYDFRYMESWAEIQNNEDFKSQNKFPNKNIVKKLENLRNQFIKRTENYIKKQVKDLFIVINLQHLIVYQYKNTLDLFQILFMVVQRIQHMKQGIKIM